MGIKNNLQTSMAKYRELKSASEKVIEEIKKSDRYSTEYKNELITEEKNKAQAIKDSARSEIQLLMSQERKRLEDKRKPVVKDMAFELRLNNALKIIELTGKDMEEAELQELVAPFKDDYGTLNAIDRILSAQGISTAEIIPREGLEYKIRSLDNTEKTLLSNIFRDNDLGCSIAVSMMPDDEDGEGDK